MITNQGYLRIVSAILIALAISVNVRFFDGRNGSVAPSAI
jgi:hypothetical protein